MKCGKHANINKHIYRQWASLRMDRQAMAWKIPQSKGRVKKHNIVRDKCLQKASTIQSYAAFSNSSRDRPFF